MTRLTLGARLALALLLGAIALAAHGLAKPPDLPDNPKITAAPQSAGVCVASGQEAPAPACHAQPNSECPYLQQQNAPRPCQPEIGPRSVLENLRSLEQAREELEKARALLDEGRVCEGLSALEKVRRLCPGSSYEQQANAALDAFFKALCIPLDIKEESTKSQGPSRGSQALEDVLQRVFGCAWSAVRWWHGVTTDWLSVLPSGSTSSQNEPADAPAAEDTGRLEILLDTHVTVHLTRVPLQLVLEELLGSQCVPLELDRAALREAGVSFIQPITIHAENVPFRIVLDLVARQAGLLNVVRGGSVRITCVCGRGGAEELSEEKAEESPCPRAEALHEQHCAAQCGARLQAQGLMKACHLALSEGRFEKAADLARQAHALDPERVEADPVIYKLHLLDEQDAHLKKVDEQQCPTGAEEPAEVVPGQEQNSGGVDNQAGQREPFICPHLPPVESGLVAALDAVVRQVEQERRGCCCQEKCERGGCPFPALAGEISDWTNAFLNRHGTLQFHLMPCGLECQVRAFGTNSSYNALCSRWFVVFWKSAKTEADIEAEKQAEEREEREKCEDQAEQEEK